MLIAFKALGATCLAGALAASGVITTDHFTDRSKDDPAAAEVAQDPHAVLQPLAVGTEAQVSADEAGVTTTTTTEAPAPAAPPPPPPAATPAPVQPTAIPVAGAGTVVLVVQGPVIVVRDVKVVPGWAALVEQRSGDINVVFRRGDRSFRFLAAFKDRRLTSDIREVRADGDRPIGFDGDRDRFDGDHDRFDGRHDWRR